MARNRRIHSLKAKTNGLGLLKVTVPSVSDTASSLGQFLSFGLTRIANDARAIKKQRIPVNVSNDDITPLPADDEILIR